ncbi:hypothetical protein [Thaumasiovibrio sp. DFM-14]|uniref:hypothetical protein n=1 Tax=Thaumasiovibrio sp. DFM-14 TaxID=3384792 RepID=UPI00399F9007
MKNLIIATIFIVLTGCSVTQSVPTNRLTLYYSAEQTTLTVKQEAELDKLFSANKQVTANIAPAKHDIAFQALIISQTRVRTIEQIAARNKVKLSANFRPKQPTDTIQFVGQ